jgi:hypothetical protein
MPLLKRVAFVLLTLHVVAQEGLFEIAQEYTGVRFIAVATLLCWLAYDCIRDNRIVNEVNSRHAEILREIQAELKVASAVMQLACPYNPADCLSLKRFRPVIRNSRCLFARGARVWGGRDYNEDWSLEENVRASVPTLLQMLLRRQEVRPRPQRTFNLLKLIACLLTELNS